MHVKLLSSPRDNGGMWLGRAWFQKNDVKAFASILEPSFILDEKQVGKKLLVAD